MGNSVTCGAGGWGAFRTEFSLRRRSPDYAETAGKRRKENDTDALHQPGDRDKAAEAIVTAFESQDPPSLLVPGPDTAFCRRRGT